MDIRPASPGPLLSAGLLLARNRIYAMAWLDAELMVTARFGDLAPGLEAGEPLHAGLPVLADYEDEIRALPRDGRSSFELPGIMLVDPDGKPAPRIDLIVYRHAGAAGVGFDVQTPIDGPRDAATGDTSEFLLLITRAGTQTMDLAVARMQRDRHILLEDIAQKKLELDRVNAELELCNRDLEDFATIISHDLKAPMRALRYLADDIETALDRGQPQAARQACADLKTQSRRMSTMLSELLDYAAVGRRKESLEACDTRALIDSITASLPRPPGLAIVIEGDWPIIETYPAPLDLVIRNLIDNAIKHHDRPGEGEIRIAATPCADSLDIVIQDDGPGIPRGRQEAVFQPFRSYRPDGECGPEATGELSHSMGLAFVKRMVATVGGRLDLSSDPSRQRGSAFKISWPVERDARLQAPKSES
ncbi:MAG: HAMP domain-containing histidine kinase [Alphaproteobacteria bacterium]|nr:HAMP domain-containing histidine kinase [Alphaproteobacteria bacterium]